MRSSLSSVASLGTLSNILKVNGLGYLLPVSKYFLSHFFYYENSRLHLQYIHVASVDRIKVNNSETEKEVKGERMEEL